MTTTETLPRAAATPSRPRTAATDLTDSAFDWTTPRVVRKLLTPAEAGHVLQHHNARNRRLVEGRAERLAAKITEGRWKFNAQTIGFDTNAQLTDGQHRCWAVVLADRPVEALLAFGLDPSVFDTIDIGARRSGGDTLTVLGVETHSREIASACQYLIRWRRGDFDRDSRLRKVDNDEVTAFYGAHPEVADTVARCYPARPVIPCGLLAAVVYEIERRRPDLADRLVDTLVEPAGAGVTDPFFLIRDYALNLKRDGRHRPVEILARLIKAANLVAAGKRAKMLVWRRQGKGAEAFPTLQVD